MGLPPGAPRRLQLRAPKRGAERSRGHGASGHGECWKAQSSRIGRKKQDQVDLEINNDDLSMILYYMILFFDR